MKQNWKEFLSYKRNRIELIISLLIITAVLLSLTNFLNYVEAREGVVINDPVLSFFAPVDVTWLTFALIYISLGAAVISFIPDPQKLLLALQVYSMMVVVRIIGMYLLPFNAPATTIILLDPFVEFFGTGQTLTKDLFFSGHTATLFILYLVSEKKLLKNIFLISTILVGISVLLQHVHYTIDVFAAPFFAYAAYRGVINFKNSVFRS